MDGCKVAFRWKTLHADPYGKWRILSGIYHEKGERWHRCADLQWSMGQKGWKTGRKRISLQPFAVTMPDNSEMKLRFMV